MQCRGGVDALAAAATRRRHAPRDLGVPRCTCARRAARRALAAYSCGVWLASRTAEKQRALRADGEGVRVYNVEYHAFELPLVLCGPPPPRRALRHDDGASDAAHAEPVQPGAPAVRPPISQAQFAGKRVDMERVWRTLGPTRPNHQGVHPRILRVATDGRHDVFALSQMRLHAVRRQLRADSGLHPRLQRHDADVAEQTLRRSRPIVSTGADTSADSKWSLVRSPIAA